MLRVLGHRVLAACRRPVIGVWVDVGRRRARDAIVERVNQDGGVLLCVDFVQCLAAPAETRRGEVIAAACVREG